MPNWNPSISSGRADVSAHIRALWRKWAGLATLLALGLALSISLLVREPIESQIVAETVQTTSVIGRALSDDLNQALGAGIPVRELVGVQEWFADALQASPTVVALALTDASGALVAQADLPDALRDSVVNRRAETRTVANGLQIITLPVFARPGDSAAGWLHVVGRPPSGASQPWLQVVLGTLICSAVAAAILRQIMRRRLDSPVRALQTLFAATARGELVQGPSSVPAGPAGKLTANVSARLQRDIDQRAELLQKASEVRAAHFDPAVLERIDALTEPVRHSTPTLARLPMPADMLPPLRIGVIGRLALASLAAIALSAALSALLSHLQQQPQQRHLVHSQGGLVASQLTLLMAEDQDRMSAFMQSVARHEPLAHALTSPLPDEAGELLSQIAPEHVTVMLVRTDGSMVATWPPRMARSQPERSVVLDLASREPAVQDIWQGSDGSYQTGMVRRLTLPGGSEPLFVVAARPFERTRMALEERLGGIVALADLRGRPTADTGVALIRTWRDHGQTGHMERFEDKETVISATPLSSRQGIPLGSLVAALPQQDQSDAAERLGAWLAMLGLAATLGGMVLYVLRNLQPLAAASTRLATLATEPIGTEPDDRAKPSGSPPLRLSARGIESSVARLSENIETLNTFRRARARQGRRQARFIRHQMLQLADRLQQTDRDAVLADLERIESASRNGPVASGPSTPPAAPIEGRPLSGAQEQAVDEIGVLALGFQGLLGRVGDQYQELARLVEELREALRVKTQFIALQRDLEIAAKIQLSFLPDRFDVCPQIDVLGAFRPAKEVGGDFYDVFRLGEHHLAITIADVSGKGVPAAFFMAVSRTLLRAVSQINEAPAECIARLNDLLSIDNRESMFVTLFYALIDVRNGQMTYTNAGHNPPYILRQDGRIESLPSSHCTALGMMEGLPYTQQEAGLGRGDALFLFTDGVTEAFNPAGEMFGEAGLETLLSSIGTLPVADIPQRAFDAVKAFEDGGPQSDDVTCIVARYLGA
jgi:serine phosphatase RsbU (regulator of sigma subunit)